MSQLYCLAQSFIINNTVNCTLEFWRGWFSELFKPVAQMPLRGFLQLLPCFLEKHALMLWLWILVSLLFSSSSFPKEGKKLPLYRWWGSVFWWVKAFCIWEVDRCCHSFWHGGYLPVSLPLCHVWPCLLWPSSMSGSIHCDIHYLPASVGIDVVPSTISTYSFWGLQPHYITWGLHPSSVGALVDVHGRSCNFPFFHLREALLVGCWVTALPLFSCDVLFLSPLTEVVLHGVGLVYLSHAWWLPIHKGTPISDMMRRSQFWWRTHDLLCWLITS